MAVGIALMPNPRGRYDTIIKQIAFFTNLGLMFVLFVAYNQFQSFLPNVQYEEKVPWLPAIGAMYHLGVDGPSTVLLVLSGLIGIISVLASLGIRERVRSYFALLLLAQACVTGAIAAHDLFVLVLFWSAAIVPIALLVLGWGGPRRESAAWRLAAYWGGGSVVLVLAVMGIYVASGASSFDMDVALKSALPPRGFRCSRFTAGRATSTPRRPSASSSWWEAAPRGLAPISSCASWSRRSLTGRGCSRH